MFSNFSNWFADGFTSGMINISIAVVTSIICLSVHEFAHGFAAYALGDKTAKYDGRLTLNPFAHVDWWGLASLIFLGFGWARPVPFNPHNFKNPKIDIAYTALAGPLSNFILAFISMFIWAVCGAFLPQILPIMAVYYICVFFQILTIKNLGLAIFNLIPIPPLDGSKILNAILPSRVYFAIMQYERYGFIILILLMSYGALNNILFSGIESVFRVYQQILSLIPFLR